MDIEEDGNVFIYATNPEDGNKALEMVKEIVKEIEVDGIYEGIVTKITTFGAFVDVGAGKEGLLHIFIIFGAYLEISSLGFAICGAIISSKIYILAKVGDKIKVRVYEIDEQGRVNLTHKEFEEDKEN